jgi:Zn-dependent metalloprotease
MSTRGFALALVAGLAVFTPTEILAQTTVGNVGPDQEQLAALETLAQTRQVSVRWDFATGTPARLRFTSSTPVEGATPEAAATALLKEVAPLYGELQIVASAELATGPALVVSKTTDLGNGRTLVDFDQVVGGDKVLGSMMRVELAQTETGLTPTWIFSRTYRGLGGDLGAFSSEIEGSLETRFPSLTKGKMTCPTTVERAVAVTAKGTRRVFKVVAHVGENPPLPFAILIDATTGAELQRYPLHCFAQATGVVNQLNPQYPAQSTQPLTGLYVFQGATQAVTDANGDYNLTGTVTTYQSMNDPGLAGPQFHVFVDGQEEIAYSGAATFNLSYTDYHQDEVAAWYNAMSFNAFCSNTYGPQMQTAVATRLPILIDSNFANAFYSPTPMTFDGESFPGYADLGIFGNAPCARDDTVLRHEHSHGFWQQLAYLYGGSDDEALGINEGMADYFPCVYNENPVLGAGVGPGVGIPYIRSCTDTFVWPQDDNGDPHRVGNILTGALWETRMKADAANKGDRLKVDQTVFQAILRYGNSPTLLQARDALVAADQATNNGAFTYWLEEALYEHGIGPAPTGTPPATNPNPGTAGQGPTIAPLNSRSTVVLGHTLFLTVQATETGGASLTLAASPLAGANFKASTGNPAVGNYSFAPTKTGTFTETFTATDGNQSSSETITIVVVTSSGAGGTGSGGTGSTAPGATGASGSGGAKASSAGGGAGCGIAGMGADPFALLPCMLLVVGVAFRRRTR